MDAFISVNSGLSHDLVMELTVYDEKLDDLAAGAFGWLTEGVAKSAIGGELGRIQQGLRVSVNGFSRPIPNTEFDMLNGYDRDWYMP
ncbi:hypothetical protein [Streptomyces sp. NPDC018352]|uniref:hypothetical protein n=1 Tax=Streptomyces sp. NPDC018352 TaxID=3157194 RepID=UPI0033E860E1